MPESPKLSKDGSIFGGHNWKMLLKTHNNLIRGKITEILNKGIVKSASPEVGRHDVVTAKKFVGEIQRRADGSVDLVAEMSKHPDALWIKVKAIEADIPNDNGDLFSEEEILKSYKTFEGVPVFTNHENNKVEAAKGKVVVAEWDDKEKSVYCTMFIDRAAFPTLARAIEEGYITDVSMGTQVDYSTCSVCQNRAAVASEYCFSPGTPVLMADLTVKNIEDVKEGDKVVDAFGDETKVIKTFRHRHSGSAQCITSRSIMKEMVCTGNHPIMTMRRGQFKFVPADCIGDKETLFTPKTKAKGDMSFLDSIALGPEKKAMLCRLMGYYAAEGCVVSQNGALYSIDLSLNQNEHDLLQDIRNIVSSVLDKNTDEYPRPDGKGISVRVYDPKLASFLSEHVPGKARTKKFSEAIINLPDNLIAEVLRGYIDGDGHVRENFGGGVVIHTASLDLSYQVYHLLNRLGCSPSINMFMQNGGPTSREKLFAIHRISFGPGQAANLKFNLGSKASISAKMASSIPSSRLKDSKRHTGDGKFSIHPCYSVDEIPYNGDVYNIETETGTYVASNTSVHNCDHVKTMKGRTVNGKKVFERNYGLKFIEISVVTDGACKDCTIRDVLDPEEFIGQASSLQRAAESVCQIVKTGEREPSQDELVELVSGIRSLASSENMLKIAGQEEISKLNQAMDLVQDVAQTMLGQRQYIDLEFLEDVVKVLADLQHVNDELVDQGYGSVGQPQPGQGVPPLPQALPEVGQESAPEVPNETMAPTPGGVGKVTEPTMASNNVKETRLSASIKDLRDKAQKIYEEAKAKVGGQEYVNINEKHQDTVRKLAGIWENPCVRGFKSELSEGEFKIIMGDDEVYGLRGSQKIASLKIADLDEDIRQMIENNPKVAGSHMLSALKVKAAGVKLAEAAPSNSAEQLQGTMEAQLEGQRVPLHPRTDEIRESITEDQLKKKTTGYGEHARKDDPKQSVTEAQLSDKRQEAPRDEVMEGQLRDKGIEGNQTPADKDSFAAGVKDQKQQITEAQLNDWREADSGHHPEMITEKQIGEQGEPWGRRIASKDDAKKALAAGMQAFARTAKATGATPAEIVSYVSEFVSSPHCAMKATNFITASKAGRDGRETILRRAAFHGTPRDSSALSVQNYLLGSLSDSGLSGQIGLKVAETIASQKDAPAKIAEAVAAFKLAETAKSEPNPSDFLREALAEESDEVVKVILASSDVSGQGEAWVNSAYEAATKVASAQGIEISKRVHVQKKDDGSVEVNMMGRKASGEKKQVVAKSAEELKSRKEARRVVAQMPGGGMPGGPDPMGAPGGTTMPMPPAAGDPTAAPPVSALGAPPAGPEGAEEEAIEGEALPPGSLCPACGSDDVDLKGGDFNCNQCGSTGTITVKIDVDTWPGAIEEKSPAKGDEEDEAGLGEGGGEIPPAGLPPVGVAASYKVTPETIKKAGKPIGRFCPHCGSSKVTVAAKDGCGSGSCETCKGRYEFDTFVDTNTKDIYARLEWQDRGRKSVFASKKTEANTKKAKLEAALRSKGLVAKFAKSDIAGKATIIADLHDEGLL